MTPTFSKIKRVKSFYFLPYGKSKAKQKKNLYLSKTRMARLLNILLRRVTRSTNATIFPVSFFHPSLSLSLSHSTTLVFYFFLYTVVNLSRAHVVHFFFLLQTLK